MSEPIAESAVITIHPYSQSSCLKCGAWENSSVFRREGTVNGVLVREHLTRTCKCGFQWNTDTKDYGARAS